jgi:predicted small lipoprotein YifL
MKKILSSIVLLLAIVISVASCNKKDPTPPEVTTPDSQQTTGENTQENPKTVWETLQELSQQKYSKVKLYIKTVTGDIELNANYTLTNTNVTYSVEQLNLLPPDGDLTNVSPNCKVALSGTAAIKNGKVEKIDGETVTLPSYNELKGAFNFKQSNFRNVKTEKGKLTADVSSISGFMGISQNLNNMRIVVIYNDTALQKLEITYKTTNSTVTTVYEFTK